MSEMHNIESDSWEWVRLGNYASKIGSGVTPRGGQESYLSSGIPLIRSQNVHMNEFCEDGLAFISDEQDGIMKGSRVFAGDILLNITGASIGRVCVVPEEICPANVNQHVSIIRVNEHFLPEFVSFYLSTPDFQNSIIEMQSGATRQALTKAQIEELTVPLPPLNEQKRITSMLKEQLADVEKARTSAMEQLEAAKGLADAFLREVFKGEESQEWNQYKLGDICTQDRVIVDPDSDMAKNLTYISLEHVESGSGRILREPSEILTDEGKSTTFAFSINHVLYGKLRPYLNKVATPNFDGRCTTELIPLKPSNIVKREYLTYILRRPETVHFAMQDKTGSRMPRADMDELMKLTVRIPPLSRQVEISTILNEQLSEAQHMSDVLIEQLTVINQLPATILHKAFSGQI